MTLVAHSTMQRVSAVKTRKEVNDKIQANVRFISLTNNDSLLHSASHPRSPPHSQTNKAPINIPTTPTASPTKAPPPLSRLPRPAALALCVAVLEAGLVEAGLVLLVTPVRVALLEVVEVVGVGNVSDG